MTPIAQSADNAVPDWLNPTISEPQTTLPALNHAEVKRDLALVQYPIVFERVIERVRAGDFMEDFIGEDLRMFEIESFDKWVNSDRIRRERYKEACVARSHVLFSQSIKIADAEGSMEDVNRSKVRIDIRVKKAIADNRKYYGESTKIEMNSTIEVKKSRDDLLREAIQLQAQADSQALALRPRGDVTDV
jgi:hypothetical protein